jgi:hypothetical protein
MEPIFFEVESAQVRKCARRKYESAQGASAQVNAINTVIYCVYLRTCALAPCALSYLRLAYLRTY